jgi:hypothetical protein
MKLKSDLSMRKKTETKHYINKVNSPSYTQDCLHYTSENSNQDKWPASYSNQFMDIYPSKILTFNAQLLFEKLAFLK